MANLQKTTVTGKPLVLEQKESLDVRLEPFDQNKENIMVQGNVFVHKSPNSSPESMDFEQSGSEMGKSSMEEGSGSESDASSAEEVIIVRSPPKKLPTSVEPKKLHLPQSSDTKKCDSDTSSSAEGSVHRSSERKKRSLISKAKKLSLSSEHKKMPSPSEAKKRSPLSEPEDGELQDDEDTSPSKTQRKFDPANMDEELLYGDDDTFFYNRMQNKGELSRDNAEKLNERAKRFGISVPDETTVSEETLLALYKSLGIPLDKVRSGKLKTVRLNSVHMRGVDTMSTYHIHKYFENFRPLHVEWLNDCSCNVIFRTDLAAARAMLELSDVIIPPGTRSTGSRSDPAAQEKENDAILSERGEQGVFEDARRSTSAPSDTYTPRGIWRKGHPTDKGKLIFLRFATTDDRKLYDDKRRDNYKYKDYGSRPYEGYVSTSGSQKRKYDRNEFGFHSESRAKRFRSPRGTDLRSDIGQSLNVELDQTRSSRRYVKHVPSSRGGWYESPMQRRTFRQYDSDSDEDNTLSAGGRKIKMRMYADAVDGTWQRLNPPPKTRCGAPLSKSPHRPQFSTAASDVSSEESPEKHSLVKKDIPSRFKIWNPIAKSMAREAELVEQSLQYRPGYQRSYPQNDLRSRISVPSSSQSYRRVSKAESGDLDLRKKLQIMRKDDAKSSHRSPLTISVQNKNEDSSDSSY